MKRITILVLVCVMAVFACTACDSTSNTPTTGPATTAHTHVYSEGWASDATNHWKTCTCGEKSEAAAHVDADYDGKCDVCAYEVGHDHAYATEWSSDATSHWHACVCGDKADTAAHTDDDYDGKCDVCTYEVGHTHVYGEEWLYDETSHWHTCVCGTASEAEAHADADFNELCDGCGTSYRDPKNYFAKVSSGAGSISDVAAYTTATQSITIKFPSAGTYVINAPALIDGSAEKLEILAPGDEYSAYTPYTYVADGAGEVEFTLSYFAWNDVQTITYEYSVIKLYDVVLEPGASYVLPTGVNVNIFYTLPDDGMYQFTNEYGAALLWNEYFEKFDYIVAGSKDEVVTFTVMNENTDEEYYAFTCDVNVIPTEGEALAIGSNNITLAPGKYTPVTLTATTPGVYKIALPADTLAAFYYESYGSLYASYETTISLELEANASITYYVADATITEESAIAIDVVFVGTYVIPDEDSEAENDYIAATGNTPVANIYVYDGYDRCETVFTAGSDVLMSFDGGVTWVTTYTVALGYYDDNLVFVGTVEFLVKNASESDAVSTHIDIENVAYTFEVSVGENDAVTLIPGKEYTVTISGLTNYYSNISISWDNTDALVYVDGALYTANTMIEMFTYWSSVVVVIPANAASADIVITVTDLEAGSGEGEGEDEGETPAGNTLVLGSNSVDVIDSFNGDKYVFTAPVAGTYYIICVDENSYNGYEDALGVSWYQVGEKIELTLEAGESVTILVATDDGLVDTIEIDIVLSAAATDGEGTTASPFIIGTSGTYTSTLAESAVAYYTYTADAACTVTLIAHGNNYFVQFGTTNFMLMAENLNPDWKSTSTVSLEAGQTLFIGVSSNDMTADTVDLTLIIEAAEGDSGEALEGTVLSLGDNTIAVIEDDFNCAVSVYYTFTAETTGDYVFASGEGESNLYAGKAVWNENFNDYDIDWSFMIEGRGSFTIALKAGETVTICISSNDGYADNVVINVSVAE